MPDAIASISSLANTLSPVLKGVSTVSGLINSYNQQQYLNKVRGIVENPAKMAQFAAGYTNPLNAGLTAGVDNQSQAYLAERGLSSSPQISQEVTEQAIAPYIQQNEQNGYQNALQALGLGNQTPGAGAPQAQSNPFASTSPTNPYLALIQAQQASQAGSAGLTPTTDQAEGVNVTPNASPAPIDMTQWATGFGS